MYSEIREFKVITVELQSGMNRPDFWFENETRRKLTGDLQKSINFSPTTIDFPCDENIC